MKKIKLEDVKKCLDIMVGERFYDYQNGIENDFDNYIETHQGEHQKEINGEIYLVDIDKDKVLNDYFTKTKHDLSAKDCAQLFLINMLGVPPVKYMTIKTFEAKFRELFNQPKYRNDVFLKRVQGNSYTACVSRELYQELSKDKSLFLLLAKQTKKALRNPDFLQSPEYSQYLLECEWEDCNDEYYNHINDENYWDAPFIGQSEKIYLMMKEIFSLFYTDFDFDSLANDRDEVAELYQVHDLGERYQELAKKIDMSSYEGVYFKSKFNEKLIDIIAEKVADKIIIALNGKGKL